MSNSNNNRQELVYLAGGIALGLLAKPIFNHITKAINQSNPKKVALVLAGCGVYDGSEVQEAVSCLIHLSQSEAEVTVFAPTMNQRHVIDHATGEQLLAPPASYRSVRSESARISRGQVESLEDLVVENFDAIVIPGGFGVAKNLCTFAFDGERCEILSPLKKILQMFHAAKKPIGMCCIAPVLAAKLFRGCELTVGKSEGKDWPYAGTTTAMASMGAVVIEKEGHEIHVDKKHKIVTAPAYMYASTPSIVYDNIGKMISATLRLA